MTTTSTHDELIISYLKLGLEQGFDNVSLAAIADDVGIKKPSVFSHFDSFSQLKQYALDYCREKLEESSFNINPKALNPDELFTGLINSFIDVFTCFPVNAYIALIDQRKSFDPVLASLSDSLDLMFTSRFRVAFDYCIQRGWSSLDYTDELATLFACRLRCLISKSSTDENDLEDFVALLNHILT